MAVFVDVRIVDDTVVYSRPHTHTHTHTHTHIHTHPHTSTHPCISTHARAFVTHGDMCAITMLMQLSYQHEEGYTTGLHIWHMHDNPAQHRITMDTHEALMHCVHTHKAHTHTHTHTDAQLIAGKSHSNRIVRTMRTGLCM